MKEMTRGIRNKTIRGLRRVGFCAVTAAAFLTGVLGGTIVTDGNGISVFDNVAHAKGGNGGGKGGGRGHGKGHGQGHAEGLARIDDHDHGQGHGHGHAKGHGHGHARDNAEADGRSDPPGAPSLGDKSASENGISAAALGSLNASNASSTARENASPNSMVGHIAAFGEAVESENINEAAEALAAKANKSITEPVVTEVAQKVGVDVSDETARAIATRAAEIQSRESEESSDQSMPGGS